MEEHNQDNRASVDRIVIPRDTVLAMLGGEWPDSGLSAHWPSGFAWDAVDHFEIEGDVLVPFAGGLPAPGPEFRLQMI